MREFEEQLLRLKQALGVSTDQEVAKELGLSKAALSDRKQRGAFPGDKLLELSARRPELRIDVHYVISGKYTQRREDYGDRRQRIMVMGEVLEAMPLGEDKKEELVKLLGGDPARDAELLVRELLQHLALTPLEQVLIDAFRAASEQDQKRLVSTALGMTGPASGGMVQTNSGSGAVQVGKAGGKVSVKKGG